MFFTSLLNLTYQNATRILPGNFINRQINMAKKWLCRSEGFELTRTEKTGY